MNRIACLYVPDFPLAARLRSEPDLKHEPLALVDGKGSHAVVINAAASVLASGVRAGFSVPQARSLFPGLSLKQRDPEAERAAQAALVETAEAFSPRVEESGMGVVYLDMCSEKNESMLVELAVRRAKRAGLKVQAGVAGGKLAALVAAEEAAAGPVVIPAGDEPAFLAPLPVVRLHPSAEIFETLGRWGLKTIGAFARLPEREIMGRLGKEGWDLHRAARGIDLRPLVARAHAEDYSEGVEFDWPILDLATFEHVARGLLERLMLRLAARDLAARSLSVTMKLEPVGADARALPLPAPTRDVTSMLGLLSLELERQPPASPIIGLTFSAAPEKPKRAQLSLFDPPALSPDALSATLARLAALVGPERFGSPRATAGHRPEGFSLEPFAPPPPENRSLFAPAVSAPPASVIAVRTLRPKVELEVRLANAGDGRPGFVRSLRNDGTQVEIVGHVKVAAGPWRVEDGWWLDRPMLRDYWDVELSDGALYRLYHDPIANRWYADGIYD